MIDHMIAWRESGGPCLFCRRGDVSFTIEHLPPESVAGVDAIELWNWVCGRCNVGFSTDEVYFVSHYHGAEMGTLRGVRGKGWRGTRVQRTDLEGRYHVRPNLATMRIKRRLKPTQISEEFRTTGLGTLALGARLIDPPRLSRCLAKMAIEAVALHKPEDAFDERFDDLRDFARGLGDRDFVPYAVGGPVERVGAWLWEIQFTGREQWVAGALIALPGASYAVQLCELDDLHPLWHVAQLNGMIFDETGTHRRVNLSLSMQRP